MIADLTLRWNGDICTSPSQEANLAGHNLAAAETLRLDIHGIKIGCWTGVKGRVLFLRSCLMQMLLQTRLPDSYVILINGEDADVYDRRAIDDLIEPWTSLVTIARSMTTLEVSTSALELLLESDAQLFFKIDSDDLYSRNYLETIVDHVESLSPLGRDQGFCLNLIDQLWLNEQPGGGATIANYKFHNGLGLSDEEKAKGMRVGAPPTFAFDRKAAELLVRHSRQPPYDHIPADDRAWRHILFDHGIVIEQVRSPEPVFGYLRHSDNTCAIKAKEKLE